jgi:hypothetical protein
MKKKKPREEERARFSNPIQDQSNQDTGGLLMDLTNMLIMSKKRLKKEEIIEIKCIFFTPGS